MIVFRDDRQSERGVALIVVLLVVALLSLIATGMIRTAHVSSQLARHDTDRLHAEALAQAGIARAILALVDRRIDHRWRVDGFPYDIPLWGNHLTLTIQDERGRIDLNNADGPLLIRLFTSAGLAPNAAAALVDKVLDWRESSGAQRVNGAKDVDYQAAGYDYGPRNGPFQSVDELLMVMGMTESVFDKVKPALTVYSQSQYIDPETAPREALLALPGMDVDQATALIAARTGLGIQIDNASSTAGVLDVMTSLAGRAFSIVVRFPERNGAKVSQTVVIRLTADPQRPYLSLAWEPLRFE